MGSDQRDHDGPGPCTDDVFGDLLLRARTAAAFELCDLVDEYAPAFGALRFEVFLVDYSQCYLRPANPGVDDDEIAIDGTIAGRAFITGTTTVAESDGEVRVWLPLIDGTDRLGVMQAVYGEDGPIDPADPRLEQLAALVAELVASKSQYSDWFRRCRRRRDLTLSAELQWRQLPPLTYTRPTFAIAGVLEPAYGIGGDAFDYADDVDGLRFDITDAMGHGTEAMLLSAAAVASLRHSRSHALGLEESYRAVDSLLVEQFGDSHYVTGMIGWLEPHTATLTLVNAGHPLPLLVRDRTVVGTLACAPSLPMGLGGPVVEIARVQLQPGDRVLFYTDGVTEARRHNEQFGVERLADYVGRATLDGHGPAETMRRLSLAVLDHFDFELGDDASMLMIEIRDPDGPEARTP